MRSCLLPTTFSASFISLGPKFRKPLWNCKKSWRLIPASRAFITSSRTLISARKSWKTPKDFCNGPYILLGKVLEKKGDFELAVRTLQHVLAMDPNNPLPHYLLGQAFHQLGRKDDADREFKLSEQLRQGRNAKP